jgi:hypothetical protein
VARRPLEREQVYLDGGRRTTQLMRDSLGAGIVKLSISPLPFLLATLLVACAQQTRYLPLKPDPVWRCYLLDPDSAHVDLVPSTLTLGTNTDRSGMHVASVDFAPSTTRPPLTLFAQWRKDGEDSLAGDSLTVSWPAPHLLTGQGVILTARLMGDSLIGQATVFSDMGPMSHPFPVRGHQLCKAGA